MLRNEIDFNFKNITLLTGSTSSDSLFLFFLLRTLFFEFFFSTIVGVELLSKVNGWTSKFSVNTMLLEYKILVLDRKEFDSSELVFSFTITLKKKKCQYVNN